MNKMPFDLLERAASLISEMEDGGKAFYGDIGESDGRKFLTIVSQESYSQICPDALFELVDWIRALPSDLPADL